MKTKSKLFFTIMIAVIFIQSTAKIQAQKIELSPFIGYETGAYVNYNAGRLHINPGMDFGGSLNIGMGGGRFTELSFSQMYTSMHLETLGLTTKLGDLVVDYYSLGILQEVRPDSKVTPYGLFTLGLVNYRPSESYSNENKMHISFAGGVKIHASERVGLRLQARLLLPIYYAGGYIFAGSGGAGYGVTGGFRGVQGDFTAALVFTLR